jgi:SagB-type dehydrogenase family enzyme
MEKTLAEYREFLRDTIRMQLDFKQTDQNQGVPMPPIEKPCAPGCQRITLPKPQEWQTLSQVDVVSAIGNRQSHRTYTTEPLTLEEAAFLLWATQGVRRTANAGRVFRTVPSAGCRHALETYLCALNVTGLDAGMYRYLPLEHQLVFEYSDADLGWQLAAATLGQAFIANAPVTFVWTTLPYRMEWRYSLAAHKVILLDAGHVCQNLYLACAAIGAGTCAIAAYNQHLMDQLVRVDGEDEFVIYLAPVGKV